MDKLLPTPDELREVFTPDAALLENVLRLSIIYLLFYFAIRFLLRRQSGPVGITNMLVLVLLADSVQNAISSDYLSVTNAVVIGVTLLFWSYTLDYLDFHVPRFSACSSRHPSS